MKKMRFAGPVASAAVAIMLLGACSDDGPTTLARGDDVEFVGSHPLSGQRMNINAEEEDGKVTGEARFDQVVVTFECADTDTEGVVILGGKVTTPSGDGTPAVGERMAVIIREGHPDSVDPLVDDGTSESCRELVESIPEDHLTDDSRFADVADGDDIETG
ncbi:MAG: hypothetical protein QOD92_708 [Acidimicrobiaceae bacterium]|jgi:hypothetical protein